MKMRRPMSFHVKLETIPGYAWCPHHGAEAILFNTVTRFYQCQALTEIGEAGFNALSTINGVPVCSWQRAQRMEAAEAAKEAGRLYDAYNRAGRRVRCTVPESEA